MKPTAFWGARDDELRGSASWLIPGGAAHASAISGVNRPESSSNQILRVMPLAGFRRSALARRSAERLRLLQPGWTRRYMILHLDFQPRSARRNSMQVHGFST